MRPIDNVLNQFTEYKIVLYLLVLVSLIALVLSFFKVIPYDPLLMLKNGAIIIASCWVFNFAFEKLFKTTSNIESTYITAFILFLIVPVQYDLPFYVFVFLSFVSMGSKYLLAIKRRHIFNPAAIGVFVTGLLFSDSVATWWVGTPILFLPVVVMSFLIIKKTRRWSLVLSFLGIYLTLYALLLLQYSTPTMTLQSLYSNIVKSALIFFASVMLTEPMTSPITRRMQIVYSGIVAVLYATSQLHNITWLVITPELALLIGNAFSYIVNPKISTYLGLKSVNRLTSDLFEFRFLKPKNFNYKPGQYMSWTLSHKKSDQRGNRRFFSITSSPTEDYVSVAFRKYDPSSTFKSAMLALKSGDKIFASGLSGDFVLPQDLSKPLAFVAGGIGITPFRSMVKYIIDKKLKADIVLVYVGKKEEDFIFMDVFEKASKYGVRTIKVLSDYSKPVKPGEDKGRVDDKMIKRDIPDYKNRTFYISGPQPLVQNLEIMFKKMGAKVRTDYFPGYK